MYIVRLVGYQYSKNYLSRHQLKNNSSYGGSKSFILLQYSETKQKSYLFKNKKYQSKENVTHLPKKIQIERGKINNIHCNIVGEDKDLESKRECVFGRINLESSHQAPHRKMP